MKMISDSNDCRVSIWVGNYEIPTWSYRCPCREAIPVIKTLCRIGTIVLIWKCIT